MKPKQRGENGTDSVAAARAAEAHAQAALSQFEQDTAAVVADLNEKAQILDETTDPAERARLRRLVADLREDAASRDRMRGKYVGDVEAAARARWAAEQRWAHEEVQRLAAQVAALNNQVIEALRGVVCPLLHDKQALKDRMAELAARHELPTPPQGILLLPKDLIRSGPGEELRDALDAARAFGVAQKPAL